jgi:hypothetical protein
MLIHILPTFQQLFNDFTFISILYQFKHIYTKQPYSNVKHFTVLYMSRFQVQIILQKYKCILTRLQSYSQLFVVTHILL